MSGGGTGAPSWGADQALYGVHRCYLSHKGSHKPRALVLSHAHAALSANQERLKDKGRRRAA